MIISIGIIDSKARNIVNKKLQIKKFLDVLKYFIHFLLFSLFGFVGKL